MRWNASRPLLWPFAALITFLSFLTTTGPSYAHDPKVVVPENLTATDFPGHVTYLLSEGANTESNVAVLQLEVPPKTFGAPPHVHEKEDEHFFVLAGEVEFLDREATIKAGPGTLVVLPRGHVHGFWNLTDEPASLLLIVTPGEFASFFDQVVAEIRAKHPHNPERVGQIIGQVAARHGVQVRPDLIPPSAMQVLPK